MPSARARGAADRSGQPTWDAGGPPAAPPFCSRSTRCMRLASCRLCVAISAATPVCRISSSSSWKTSAEVSRIEVAGRLVGQQQPRAHWRARGRSPCAAARRPKLRRAVIEPLAEAQHARAALWPALRRRRRAGAGDHLRHDARSRAPRTPAAAGGTGRRSPSRRGARACARRR